MEHEYDSVPKPAAQRLQRLGERLEVGHRTVERGVLDCAGQVPLQRRGDVRRLLPHHVPHCQLSGVVLLPTLKDCFQRLLE